MTLLCYQAPPSASSSVPLRAYAIVRPDEQGCFQGIGPQPSGLWVLFQNLLTTKDSIYRDPYIFLIEEDANYMCEHVNNMIDYHKETIIREGFSTTYFVVIPITLKIPHKKTDLEEWTKNHV